MKINALTGVSTATLALGMISVHAQNLNGTVNSGFYGSAAAVETINTGFGDNNSGGGDANSGSELDAAYGKVSGGNLFLFIAGDFQNNGNALDLIIGGGGSTVGQNTLNTTIGPMSAMNGSVLSPGMNATMFFSMNDSSGTWYTDAANLQAGSSVGGYVGAISGVSGIYAFGAPSGGSYSVAGLQMALNNTHTSTQGASGAALSGATSGAATTTGLELEIPLASLGTISGNIEVLAAINNSGDNYLSNQLLPGQPVGTGNIGSGILPANPGYFTVAVPEPSTFAAAGVSGVLALLGLRRRK